MSIDELKQLLIDQKNIFGDDLFETIDLSLLNKNSLDKTKTATLPEENNMAITESFLNIKTLDDFDSKINNCTKCKLGTTRKNFVFGTGNPNADFMLIGEAPGRDEDLKGEPFVGRAGKLLNDILLAIKFKREDVYIANILKCRPPNNRDPLVAEMEICTTYLKKQIDLIKPKVILCLGRIAGNSLLGKNLALAKLRGQTYDYESTKLMVTYHPAALLRNPHWKKDCWIDVQAAKKLFDELT